MASHVKPQESMEDYRKRMKEAREKTKDCKECGGSIVVDKVVNGITISTPCSICCAGR